jgi:hypothetical protein
MIEGSCHCGAVRWRFEGMPEFAEACSCTLCRRYGVLWGYGFEGQEISVSGPTQIYAPRKKNEAHFCPVCACIGFWRNVEPGPNGRRRMAVNLRLAEPEAVARLPIDRVDGLHEFEHLPRDGRCVADYWF